MNHEIWEHKTDAALAWLRKSFAATGEQGSAHSWHPLLGWAKAYPETTGYLIETLLAYAAVKQDDSLKKLALDSAIWLDRIQLPSGAFPGLLAGNTKPSVFNTSQILFAAPQLSAPEKAIAWLLSVLESDGSWQQFAFVPGFVPTYYTRAVWGILQANKTVQNTAVEPLMQQALHFYAARFLPNGAVRDWGFHPGTAAFTHTIAYTLEGFWEAATYLKEPAMLDKTIHAVERLLKERKRTGRTAGRYDEKWQGDYSFVCVTGNCQLSLLCHKIWKRTGDQQFLDGAIAFLKEVMECQSTGANKNSFGAFPGSVPRWGAYLPFRYPNWSVKFFLDAMLELKDTICAK